MSDLCQQQIRLFGVGVLLLCCTVNQAVATAYGLGCLGILVPVCLTRWWYFRCFGASQVRRMLFVLGFGEFLKALSVVIGVSMAALLTQEPFAAVIGVIAMCACYGFVLLNQRK